MRHQVTPGIYAPPGDLVPGLYLAPPLLPLCCCTAPQVYGGQDAPYIWVGFPGKASWDVFADILEKCNIVTTPGSGFGPAGEGFVRVSAFNSR